MFKWSKHMAVYPNSEASLFPKLRRAYERRIFFCRKKYYVEKNHPNIWTAEKLLAAFPDAKFISIERNPYATIASMINHKRVSEWHHRWKEFPIPNRFLGISDEDAKVYDEIPFARKCAMRWVAHHNRLGDLKPVLGGRLLHIQYEDFASSPDSTIEQLNNFLALDTPLQVPTVKTDSLTKWREELSDSQISEIQATTNQPLPDQRESQQPFS